MMLDIVAFTARGAALAERLLGLYPDSRAVAPKRYCRGVIHPLDDLGEWTQTHFRKGRTLIYIGAAGIAVRAIAPFVKDKATDAAVLCIDENGENIVSLLSGHIGGANRAAKAIAQTLGGHAVITAATDVNNVFAVDDWAVRNNCVVANPSAIKRISASLLDGETVGLRSAFPIEGRLPAGIAYNESAACGIEIAIHSTKPFAHTLHIVPRVIIAGIGCRKNVPADLLEKRLSDTLTQMDLPVTTVGMVATIDIKAKEPGLLALCDRMNAAFVTYTAEDLLSVKGDFTKSELVRQVTGVDNVCERAVVCAGARLIAKKNAGEGVTVALGILNWTVNFEVESK